MASLTNLETNKTFFIACDCRNEILMIEYDHEYSMAELAIYEHYAGFRYKLSLWQRIKYCWQVLINKKPYTDQISLNKNQLIDLKSFLLSLDL